MNRLIVVCPLMFSCSLYVVQRALGHHSPAVTMRYAHLSDHAMQQAFDKVGEMLPGTGQREEKN